MNMIVANILRKKIKENKSVYSLFRHNVMLTYNSYKQGLIDKQEYKSEYLELLVKCGNLL